MKRSPTYNVPECGDKNFKLLKSKLKASPANKSQARCDSLADFIMRKTVTMNKDDYTKIKQENVSLSLDIPLD